MGVVQMGHKVRGRYLGAEVVDLPAVQLDHLGQQACGQRGPLTVHAGHRHPAPSGGGAGGRVRGERGHGSFIDGGRGMFLDDADAVGRPFRAHLALHGRDHVQQHAFCVQPAAHRLRGRYLSGRDRATERKPVDLLAKPACGPAHAPLDEARTGGPLRGRCNAPAPTGAGSAGQSLAAQARSPLHVPRDC